MGRRDSKEKISGQELQDFLKKAQKRLKLCIDGDDHNRREAIEDLKFINGEQWDAGEKQRRSLKKRPALQVNLLNKYRNQLVGEQRQNRPKIKVRPVDSKADVHIAKIREGIISNIDYLSNSKVIYDQAYAQMVECGYGAWRILTRYTEENPFIQEIYKELINNPFAVYLDPEAKDPNGVDAAYGFVLKKMSREAFTDAYPKADVPDDSFNKGKGMTDEHWYDKDTVTVAEYFVRESEKEKMALLSNGEVMPYKDAEELVAGWEKSQAGMKAIGQEAPDTMVPQILKDREVEKWEVKQYIISFTEILEEHDWPGSYIPLIMVYGRERNIEGKRYIKGLIRDAKDPQKMFNYWYTSAAENIALAPKSPWLGTAKQFEGYEQDYASANIDNVPFLKYKADPHAAGPPQRQPAPQPNAAMFAAINDARQNIKDALGMYNADVGDHGRELSGEAIKQRQMPGDTGSFDIYDNLLRAIEHDGRVINDLIPYIYDTERDARIRNVDDSETFVPINTSANRALDLIQKDPNKYQGIDADRLKHEIKEKGANAKYNDITAGKYGVVISTGKNYASQRQEAAENFLKLLQTPLGAMIERVAPDLVIRNLDFLDADEFAERVQKLIPPGIRKPKPGEQPAPPLPPPPAVQLQMMKSQTEQAKQAKEKIALQVQLVKLYKETTESESGMRKVIMGILGELHAPQHPADIAMAQQLQAQAGGMR